MARLEEALDYLDNFAARDALVMFIEAMREATPIKRALDSDIEAAATLIMERKEKLTRANV